VQRGGWKLDNGYCREARYLVYFSGEAPGRTANCKPNEVSVPAVVGMTEEGAVERLARQPLSARVAYVPAKPGRPPGRVVKQDPAGGGLSASDTVLLSVSKPRDGLVPNLIGSSTEAAAAELERRGLRLAGETAPGPLGIVLEQRPRPGVTASPNLTVRVVVGDGSRSGTR
jgi:beta-lactam-binding protein with PASTA domain